MNLEQESTTTNQEKNSAGDEADTDMATNFDLNFLCVHFEKALLTTTLSSGEKKRDVDLKEYIKAYENVNKMFPILGYLFSFVSSDVDSKCRILETRMKSTDYGKNYTSISRMIGYEKENKVLSESDPVSGSNGTLPNGCRTLLRLHRALEFIMRLLIDLASAASDQSARVPAVARKAYDETLSKHHPWLVRKGVHMALHALPNRSELLKKLGGGRAENECVKILFEAHKHMQPIYETSQELFAHAGLLELP